MTATASHVPTGLGAVTPYLLVADVDRALDFYVSVFGAEQLERFEHDGAARHAKLRIERSVVELGQHGNRTSDDVDTLPATGMHLYVADVDDTVARAEAAGAKVMMAAADQPYGDREATIADPFGVVWFVATHQAGNE